MDFYNVVEEIIEGETHNPYAGRIGDKWLEGTISIDFLNEHFGQFTTADEMINATESEGLKLYFAWLRDKGILP